MNCFEWQNGVSEYLDGTLAPLRRRSFEEHTESCLGCARREEHFRLILRQLQAQQRLSLTSELRNRLGAGIQIEPPAQESRRQRIRTWLRAHPLFQQPGPWHQNPNLRRGLTVGLALIVILLLPQFQKLYETHLDRRLETYFAPAPVNPALPSSEDPTTQNAPVLFRGRTEATALGSTFTSSEEGETTEENDAEDTAEEAASSDAGMRIKTGVWRFHLKTDSPKELRLRIVQTLGQLGIQEEQGNHSPKGGYSGIEAPGGIQFDFIAAKSVVSPLKERLEQLTSHDRAQPFDPELPAFTWYRSPLKQRLPSGKVRVVIWLSQI